MEANYVPGKQQANSAAVSAPAVNTRLLSLDFFRGFTVAAMILVNNPGDWGHIYAPLEHSKWNGCTPTDLVFPSFLFMVGVSIVYAMQSKKADAGKHGVLMLSILRRTLILFALGVFLPLLSDFQFAHLRIPGVLQRIAVVYGITALIFLKTGTKTQVYIAVAALILYYVLMTIIPVPGFGPANLEPETNLGAWLDRLVFTQNHLWASSKTWDPEGLLGTMPAVSTCLTGVLTGLWLKKGNLRNSRDLFKIIGAGVLMVLVALLWNIVFPINKSLWTSSFVLYTAGLAIIFLSVSYWFIDVKGHHRLVTPFIAFGRNAITAYILGGYLPMLIALIPVTANGHQTNAWSYMYGHYLVPNFSPENASLLAALVTVVLVFIPIWFMYVKNIIVKI
jgi:predicted acyltransferase